MTLLAPRGVVGYIADILFCLSIRIIGHAYALSINHMGLLLRMDTCLLLDCTLKARRMRQHTTSLAGN